MDEFVQHEAVQLLDWLAGFGADAKDGVTRLLYSSAWQQAQLALHGKMQQFGLLTRFDSVGNLFGRLEGSNPGAPVILTGSHVDTVRHGGKFDGAYGIVAGLLALKYLSETYGPPERSIEVVSLCEEEGSRFPLTFWGSGSITGKTFKQDLTAIRDDDGITFHEAMIQCGYNPEQLVESVRDDIMMFIELHVEQGCYLERDRKSVGIVERIVGQRRILVHVTGEANHAGTTPMRWRKDALHGAVEMVQHVLSEAASQSSHLVATVGKLEVSPNVSNVIPGKACFSLDIRHPEQAQIEWFSSRMMSEFSEIAKRHQLEFSYEVTSDSQPVAMNSEIIYVLKNTCERLNVSYRMMDSGAGHDAQIFSALCPTGLLFVPSSSGVSHSPHEYTEPEQLLAGIKVLSSALYELAYQTTNVVQEK